MKKQTIIVILLLIIVMACKSRQQQIKNDLTEAQKKEIINEIDDILLLDQKYKTILLLKNLDEAILKKDDELAKKRST